MDGWMDAKVGFFLLKDFIKFFVYSKGMEGKTMGGKKTGSDLEIEICNGASLMEFCYVIVFF